MQGSITACRGQLESLQGIGARAPLVSKRSLIQYGFQRLSLWLRFNRRLVFRFVS